MGEGASEASKRARRANKKSERSEQGKNTKEQGPYMGVHQDTTKNEIDRDVPKTRHKHELQIKYERSQIDR